MSKKGKDLLNKYIDKLSCEHFLYNTNYYNVKEYIEMVSQANTDFNNLITGMFHYHLISDNDFTELMTKATDIYIEYIELKWESR